MYDFDMLTQLADSLPEHSPLSNRARAIGNDIMNAFDGTLESVTKGRKLAQGALGSDWEKEYNADPNKFKQNGNLWAIGYCHIDTAWLWPWRVTQQKVARSWSSQVRTTSVDMADSLD